MKIQFLQAKHYKPIAGDRGVRYICLHVAEVPEKNGIAGRVAKYFSHMSDGRVASAHFSVDNTEIWQCVKMSDVAYAAKGLNANGIHIELAGVTSQTKEGWQDEFSQLTLKNAAWLCKNVILPEYPIPIVWRTAEDLKRGVEDTSIKGFTQHREVTLSGISTGDHLDCGVHFPYANFLEMVQSS